MIQERLTVGKAEASEVFGARDRRGTFGSGSGLGRRGVAALFDLSGAGVGTVVAVSSWEGLTGRTATAGEWVLVALMGCAWVAGLSVSRGLKGRLRRSLLEDLPEVVRQVLACSAAASIFAGVPLFWLGFVGDLGVASFGAGFGLVCAPFARLGLYAAEGRGLLKGAGAPMRMLAVGAGPVGRRAAGVINRNPRLRGTVVGFVDGEGFGDSGSGEASRGAPGPVDGLPVLGGFRDLGRLIDGGAANAVLLCSPRGAREEDLVELVLGCDGRGVPVLCVPDLYEATTARSSVELVGGVPLTHLNRVRLKGANAVAKRAFDLALTLAGLLVVWPVLLALAVAVKLDSPGPVFFSQERVGPEGRTFRMYKFRSMRADAEGEATWTTASDPRRTRLGKIMRPLNLDELPQVFNVLKGDLSLVGPRPEQPGYAEEFARTIRRYADRHRIRGGITGWAQVNGLRGDTSIEERAVYDNSYIENWSLWLDVKILVLTFCKAGISAAERAVPEGGAAADAAPGARGERRQKGRRKDRRHAGRQAAV